MKYNCPRCNAIVNSVIQTTHGDYDTGTVRSLALHYQQDCPGVRGDKPPITVAEDWAFHDLNVAGIPRTKMEVLPEPPEGELPYHLRPANNPD